MAVGSVGFLGGVISGLRPAFSRNNGLSGLRSICSNFGAFLFIPGRASRGNARVRSIASSGHAVVAIILTLIPTLLFNV